MEYTCKDIAKMIDLSLLRPELTEQDIIEGCDIAKQYDVATICCAPWAVPLGKKLLEGSDVKVTTVVGFPLGYTKTCTKVFEAYEAIKDGAEELDMVINIEKMLSRDFDYVQNDVKAVVDVAHTHDVLVKVILENHYLTSELIEIGSRLCEQAGADWVKTSTGFAETGATLEDLKLMRKTVSDKVQVKAAGGVRDLDAVLAVRAIGVTRFGCTRTPEIMAECAKRTGGK
jgi:deoxyribose-phosphate aldolase